jgi:putative nucleotidyltransferase with HDIG domain
MSHSSFIEIDIHDLVFLEDRRLELYAPLGGAGVETLYVKIRTSSDPRPRSDIHRLIQDGVSKVALPADRLSTLFTAYADRLRASIQNRESAPELAHLLQSTFRQIQVHQVFFATTPALELETNRVMDVAIEAITRSDDRGLLLNCLLDLPSRVLEHATGVAVTATAIAIELGWTTPGVLKKLAIAGLLHDIGDTPKSDYSTHPERGAALVERLRNLPPEISNIILQHHERLDGSGFPVGLRAAQILPAAMLIATAELLLELMNSPDEPRSSISSAVHSLVPYGLNRQLPAEAILAAFRLFRMDDTDARDTLIGLAWKGLQIA